MGNAQDPREPGNPCARAFAFFDLDGTLLPWDTQLLLANFVLRRAPWRRVFLLPVLLVLPLRLAGFVSTGFVKRLFLGFLAGMSRAEIEALGEEFAAGPVEAALWPELRAEVEARRREGCLLVLNTASPSFYAEPIARRLGFDHCVCTMVEVPERMPWPPVFLGPNNKRQAKIQAMIHRGLWPQEMPLPLPGAWTYTDSCADLPLLSCAEHGILVHPRPAFAALAPGRGWSLRLPFPPVPRWQRVTAGIAMFLGCWNPPEPRNKNAE